MHSQGNGLKLIDMKAIALVFFLCLSVVKMGAQCVAHQNPDKYEVVVSFGSICCGPASDDFLKPFLNDHPTAKKRQLLAWKIGGCGREGEYHILLSLANWKASEQKKLIRDLQKLIEQQNKINKKKAPSKGNIYLQFNVAMDAFTHCRGQLAEWNFTTSKEN